MAMLNQQDLQNVAGRDVYDRSDTKIGKAGQLYVDASTGEPEWLCVNTGLFGTKESFVPLTDAQLKGDDVYVAFDKDQVKGAPNIDPGAEGIMADQERQLYDYYSGLGWQPPRRRDPGQPQSPGTRHAEQRGGHEAMTRSEERGGGEAMTRSEERLRVDTQTEQTGTARLRKYVTTEPVETTVQVRREEPRIEREPITDANRDAALAGPDLTESEHEVTLHAERPVTEKETVPVERVRLTKETVTEEQTVGDEVRKEQIDTDEPQR
jgi:uncharacterized protein (TIGR02271 family)